MLALADEDTVVIVISDHGFETVGKLRHEYEKLRGIGHVTGVHDTIPPPDGVIIMAGGPVKSAYEITGASVYDVAPTVLYLLGFPVAEDMVGDVLTDALDENWVNEHPPSYIPSYIGLRTGTAVSDTGIGGEERTELFKDLGYF
jgi:arylsulfatase A-like enzyme